MHYSICTKTVRTITCCKKFKKYAKGRIFMKKRVLAMLLSVTMVASILAGCGGDSGQPDDGGAASADNSGGNDSTEATHDSQAA